jgi:hypothetical protein
VGKSFLLWMRLLALAELAAKPNELPTITAANVDFLNFISLLCDVAVVARTSKNIARPVPKFLSANRRNQYVLHGADVTASTLLPHMAVNSNRENAINPVVPMIAPETTKLFGSHLSR